jgi:hypothetical protein
MYTGMSNWIRFISFNYMKMMNALQCEFSDKDKMSYYSHLNKIIVYGAAYCFHVPTILWLQHTS